MHNVRCNALFGDTHRTRTFSLSDYGCEGDLLQIGTDASPWRIRGWFMLTDAIIAYFPNRSAPRMKASLNTSGINMKGSKCVNFLRC